MPLTNTAQRSSFFRQSGWLMIANIAGGALMWLVHFLSKKLPNTEYGLFSTYLSVAMCIPTMPLQVALAHQTALALARGRLGALAGIIRVIWLATSVIWLIGAAAVFLVQKWIIQDWHITNPAGLWVTMGVVLLSFWLPMFWGVLQGQQNFLWLGWSMILNGVGRLGIASICVLALHFYAAGMMTGVLLGLVLAATLAAWHSRRLWQASSAPFDYRALLKEIIPPMFGLAAFQFLFTGDMMFVRSYFNEDTTGFYGGAGTLSRALMWLVGPLAAVMFPRLVHSAAKSEKSDLMKMVLIGTGVLAVLGAVALSIIGPYVILLVYKREFVQVTSSLLPWYAGAMVPLALANVLLSNLLARSQFKVVVPLAILAVGYGFALTRFHDTLITVLKTMGAFNLMLLVICGWFTISTPEPRKTLSPA